MLENGILFSILLFSYFSVLLLNFIHIIVEMGICISRYYVFMEIVIPACPSRKFPRVRAHDSLSCFSSVFKVRRD